MSEMGDWINQLALQGVLTRPPGENVIYGDPVTNAPPGTVLAEKPTAPQMVAGGNPAFQELYGIPDAGSAAPPAAAGMAPLEAFLRYYQSGNETLTPEMYDYFGGDNILKALEQYNPGVRWVDNPLYSGEGGQGPMGRKLQFADNQIHLPASGSGIDLLNMRAAQGSSSAGLKNPNYVYHDPIYGDITHSANLQRENSGIEKWAPAIAAAIAMGGPALAGALAAGGVGLGAAGATSAVTGSAAGLPWANIPGGVAAGMAGNAAPASSWWSRALGKAPQTAGRVLSGAPSVPRPPAPRPPTPRMAPTGGTPPMFPDPYGFNPTAFNAGGSAKSAGGSDSSLVATQFAADPYGFSKGY